jgi:[ribosomal protein S18]-alanine N-acetyltransferase
MNTIGEITRESPDDDVIEMDQKYFPNPWDSSQWLSFAQDLNQLFTWRSNGELIGFALFGTVPGDDVAHLYKIVVAPHYRGPSTGDRFWPVLSARLITMGMKSVYLEVSVDNSRAIRFYEKLGFKTLRRVHGFYSDGGDAQIMILTLGA